ncbi:alkaline phosphatase family protein [Sphaerisporangium sp. NPDC051011]|uniref:alkaline phosphatase family protein n=1 Tax=Sphaerisporangium sp. NPDC051011 TaxID=3155792 RepID=UPI0033C127BE
MPKVSYIVPSSVDSEHPSASSPAQSAVITYDILDAIASNPDVWRVLQDDPADDVALGRVAHLQRARHQAVG